MSDYLWVAFGLAEDAGEWGVQGAIQRGLTYFSEQDQKKFRRKFDSQRDDDHQAMHTFRELLVGVFMIQQGFKACYEPKIEGLTPDWLFERDGQERFIADLVNFHVEQKVELQIDRALAAGLSWCGELPDQSQRLHSSLWKKADKYNNLAARKTVPYVVFIFGWMTAVLQAHQVEVCLDGLFADCPTLSGLFHMYERGNCLCDDTAGYRFGYYGNPKAIHPIDWLTNGVLPYQFPACPTTLKG
jgi:hypothetical protein